ncbi:MAG: ABC transporter permease [Clostridia bacterium]|nr:ABC transporter permease [Clostridia bacterium]
MKSFSLMLKRNVVMFFKDKMTFFVSLITPMILLVLYATFLGNVYKNSLVTSLPVGITISEGVINGFVGGQLFSSLLAVSCITVSFNSNMLSVQDKINGALTDFNMTPLNKGKLSLSYFFASVFSTLIVCFFATLACCIYIALIGWYMTFADILLIFADVIILVIFGTALSSVINIFLTTQGQISAVGSIVSSCYGFISGAYMPLSQLGSGFRAAVMFLPGTYGTSVLRNAALGGVIGEIAKEGVPDIAITGIRDSVDCNLYFFGTSVSVGAMYAVLLSATVIFVCAYVALNKARLKKGAR